MSFAKKHAYVLISRKDKNSAHPNLIGSGSYKEVYPALKIHLKSLSVIDAVQIVPARHDRFFDAQALALMNKFSGLGKGFPKIFMQSKHFSFKKNGDREIAVQELWGGGSLRCYTKEALIHRKEPPLSLEKQIFIASDLGNGMKKIHKLNLVHGDVKPSNCLFDGNKMGCITDFDLLHEAGKSVSLWQTKMYYGSVPYVPPEELSHQYIEEGAGQPGDMYALGLVLYEMAIGRPEWFEDLVADYKYFEPIIGKSHRKYLQGRISYKACVAEIKGSMSRSTLRGEVIRKQQDLLIRLNELSVIRQPTLEQKYHLLVYKMLHPDPFERLTAEQFYKEINQLKKAASRLS